MLAENNRWTSPWLDGHAAMIRQDADLKCAISRLKLRFMASPEAMIHRRPPHRISDAHDGGHTRHRSGVRIHGPMGFDVGAIIANLLLNYFSQIGHERSNDPREEYRAWILETVEEVWTLFRCKFLDEWKTHGNGDGYPSALFADSLGNAALAREREVFMDRIFQDTLGFAAAKMIRRIVGLAHNIDLESIESPEIRATAEARSLTLAAISWSTPGPIAASRR